MTSTASATATVGAPPVKTRMPSDVATAPSTPASGSWIQKPFADLAVTMPSVSTGLPASGEMWEAPWMS